MAIWFCTRDRAKYGWMSNFYAAPIKGPNDLVWVTNEHAYQACKTTDSRWQERIRNAAGPAKARRLGRGAPLRPDWNQLRYGVMLRVNRAKYTQYPDLAAKLLATGTQELVEDTPWDSYWGHGRDGCGQNTMGRVLSVIRDELRKAQKEIAE
jgi:ribA/ribD-fused uncharacterized protein